MTRPFFFGYGSLVNRATHDYPDAAPARLNGWRRVWRQTGLREVAFLSIEPCDQTGIDGLIAHVPGNDWAALDAREWAYDRFDASPQVTHDLPHAPQIAAYAVPLDAAAAPSEKHPILLSYLDVVVQGYLREFGEAGARAFFASTAGWDAPICDDRATPIYPRHQSLTAEERAFVDQQLAAVI